MNYVYNPFETNSRLVLFDDFSEWISARKRSITGTDAYMLLMGKFRQLAQEKQEGKRIPQTIHMKIGLALESVISEYAEKDLGVPIIRAKNALFYSKSVDGISGSLDGWTGDGRVIEFKCSVTRGFWPDDGVPDSYYCQVQHYMLVTGAKIAHLYALLLFGEDIAPKRFVIERDDELCDEIARRVQLFAQAVGSGKEVNDIEPYHLVKRINGEKSAEPAVTVEQQVGEPVKPSRKIAALMTKYANVAAKLKKLEAQKEEIATQLKENILVPVRRPADGTIWRVDTITMPVYSIPAAIKEQYKTGTKQYKKLTIVGAKKAKEETSNGAH